MKKSILVISILSVLVFAPFGVSAWDFYEKSGFGQTSAETGHKEINLDLFGLPDMIGYVIALLLEFLGIIFLLLLLYGGYLYLIDRGNEDKVKEAIKTIQNAVLGLIIVSAAYAIVYFIGTTIIPIFK